MTKPQPQEPLRLDQGNLSQAIFREIKRQAKRQGQEFDAVGSVADSVLKAVSLIGEACSEIEPKERNED